MRSTSAPRSWAGASSAHRRAALDRRRHGRRMARLVGTEPTLPHAGLRADPPPAPANRDGGRDHLPLRDATPQEALELAREAAGGRDVRIGGGPATIRDFLAADLIDVLAPGAGADRAGAWGAPLGRAGGARGTLRHRGGLLPERRDPPDVHAQADNFPGCARRVMPIAITTPRGSRHSANLTRTWHLLTAATYCRRNV